MFKSKIPIFIYFFAAIIILAGIQTIAVIKNANTMRQITEEMANVPENALQGEKSRQEIIKLKANNTSTTNVISNWIASIGPWVTTIVALTGALLGLKNYLDTREKERQERAANDLKDILSQTADEKARLRIVGVVGIQHFFLPDKKEYHLQTLSSLVAIARIEEDDEVRRNIKIAAESAVRKLDHSLLKQVTWQNVILNEVDFSKQNLRGLNFKDAHMEDADFRKADLSAARFVNARLNGALFDGATLEGVDLTYADLAGASLVDANLKGANLSQTKVLRMNINGANLQGAVFDLENIPWQMINGWRNAQFDKGVKESLLEIHGPAPSGKRVLMLMWEIPPLVAGGTWTASYHLVRNLQKRGVRMTIIVPWRDEDIFDNPFGCDVDVIPLGIKPPTIETSAYANSPSPPWSPYSRAYGVSPYGSSLAGVSSYGGTAPYHRHHQMYHPYSRMHSPYSDTARRTAIQKGTSILRLAEEFKRRFVKFCRNEAFDIIHAHDWITFGAAQTVSKKMNKPWVAQYHSTERDRRTTETDRVILRLEQVGAQKANHVVVPSTATRTIVGDHYGIESDKITVVPNPLSVEKIAPYQMGDFERGRVVFTGRLTEQKGPDRFLKIAEALKNKKASRPFWVYGSGEQESLFMQRGYGSALKGPLEWQERGMAFKNAAAVLVTSRSEPFGMVVLEAMQHQVPVFYPEASGAAEILKAGIKIDPEATDAVAEKVHALLENWEAWENIVQAQEEDIQAYLAANHETILMNVWDGLSLTEDRDDKTALAS